VKFVDRNGDPITMEEFMEKMADDEYRFVEVTMIEKGSEMCRVSTVWLGVDHDFEDETPQLFETMIFGGSHAGFERRYATELEALTGHSEAIQMIAES
jgi:hypothetical protein